MVVIDTNVVIAGLRSSAGASHRLLRAIADGKVEFVLSTALVLEYEYAMSLNADVIPLTIGEMDGFLDSMCAIGSAQATYYLWRPFLSDTADDHVLELAVAAQAEAIVTYNSKDFKGSEQFGIRIIRPHEFLKQKGIIQ